MKKTFIIAEAGVNHNGSLELAGKMIDAAVEAGAMDIDTTFPFKGYLAWENDYMGLKLARDIGALLN